ncbi:hypothetical protein HALTITAN_3309, partial [Vreelandella titanicae BH1]
MTLIRCADVLDGVIGCRGKVLGLEAYGRCWCDLVILCHCARCRRSSGIDSKRLVCNPIQDDTDLLRTIGLIIVGDVNRQTANAAGEDHRAGL